MITKEQFKILELFTSNISKRFSKRQVAKLLKKDPSQIHKSLKLLINKQYLNLTEENLLRLNYNNNHQELSFVEYLRFDEFIKNPKNKSLRLFFTEVIDNIGDEYFILLIFGSSVINKNPRDVDILAITNSNQKVEKIDKFLQNTAENYSSNFDINVISTESVFEMFSVREEKNILNESLNKHLIVFGAENFYKLLKNARR